MTGTADTAFDLGAYLAGEREEAGAALRRAIEAWRGTVPGELLAAVEHGVTGGGKRVRPVLCVAAWRAARGAAGADGFPSDDGAARAHDLGAALELVHAYSLMHDDLPCMDDAELRRGRPCTHRVHGVGATTLAGALLIPLAVRHALEAARRLGCAEQVARAVARELTRAAGAGGMVGGQVLDLEGEARALSPAEVDRLHRLKTGALLTAALRMGGRAGGATDEVLAALDAYGRAIGLAFQIADDVLDATASAGVLGKNPSDEARGKSTYVALFGLDEARRRGEARVAEALDALDRGGLAAPPLRALARYIVERRR